MEDEQWGILRNLVALTLAQASILDGLWKIVTESHHRILRRLCEEAGVDLTPEVILPLDPEDVAKMRQGLAELERIFGLADDRDEEPPQIGNA